MSCKGCVFLGTFQDMGASCDVCNLQCDLVKAITACENSASCQHRFTVEEAKKIVYEKAGRLPAGIKPNDEPCIVPEQEQSILENLALQGQLADAFQKVSKLVFDAVNSLIQNTGEKQ